MAGQVRSVDEMMSAWMVCLSPAVAVQSDIGLVSLRGSTADRHRGGDLRRQCACSMNLSVTMLARF